MFTREFWKDAAERSLWTFIQAFGGFLFASQVLDESNWQSVLVGALVAGGLAVVKALAATKFGNKESAALPETKPPTVRAVPKG